MLKEKLKNTCSFMAALEDKDETGYPSVFVNRKVKQKGSKK